MSVTWKRRAVAGPNIGVNAFPAVTGIRCGARQFPVERGAGRCDVRMAGVRKLRFRKAGAGEMT